MEDIRVFEQRKQSHITWALDPSTEAVGRSGLDRITLMHEALPELSLEDIDITTDVFQKKLDAPFLISSMTAGHVGAHTINQILAEAAQEKGWAMGVGSQRRELTDASARAEWSLVRKSAPRAVLFGNIGISQLIQTSPDQIQKLVDGLEAAAMIVHLNPLQECMQPEGTPHFAGGLTAIEKLVAQLSVPVIVKETGCGFSEKTLRRLASTGVKAVDVSGLGGTHWGRIEGKRAEVGSHQERAAETFKNWGISTVQSVLWAKNFDSRYDIWASGGVRNGLDAAKLLSLGAKMVGFAKPVLESALKGPDAILDWMSQTEFELRVALLCTGSRTPVEIKGRHYAS